MAIGTCQMDGSADAGITDPGQCAFKCGTEHFFTVGASGCTCYDKGASGCGMLKRGSTTFMAETQAGCPDVMELDTGELHCNRGEGGLQSNVNGD